MWKKKKVFKMNVFTGNDSFAFLGFPPKMALERSVRLSLMDRFVIVGDSCEESV